jgi:transposase InsO family protein
VNPFIDEYRARCGVEPICRALQVAPSAYRRHAARQRNPALLPPRAQRDAQLLAQVQRVYDQNLRVYGADKVWRQLRREGTTVARCTVERLMRLCGLQGVRRGKSVRTTVPDAKAACPRDRVNRHFKAQRPNQLWVADFTYVSTWQGFVYVAFVIDVFARRIVGWRVSSSMQTDFVLDALEQALYARRAEREGELVHHSDRGLQGGFNRSSQHRVVERILDTRSRSQPVSSSPAFYAACCSRPGPRLESHARSSETGQCLW